MKYRKYCALRRVLYFLWLKDVFVDMYARFLYKPRLKKLQSDGSTKLLFFNSGHLGDALIMSYCLPEIKKKYPNIIIDVVCGEWCKFVFEQNPLVRKVIVQNHFMTNRSPISEWQKMVNHFKTTQSTIKELQNDTYDFSIDVRFSAAVSHWILPFIKVRRSFGFGSRGYGGLLEKEFFLPDTLFHAYDMISVLLNEIGIESNLSNVQPYLPFYTENKEKAIKKTLITSNSLLIFAEAGSDIKMFDNGFWVDFCRIILEKSSYDLLLCGQTEFTKILFSVLQEQLPMFGSRISFTTKNNLSTIAALPQIAAAAITLDSFPAHLCSIFCKTLVLSKNATGYQFFPLNNTETLLLHDHSPSRATTLSRAKFSSQYVENLNEITTNEGLMASVIDFL